MGTFSEWLQTELDQREWTQADLARKSGISGPQITRILNESRGAGEDALRGIARAFGIPEPEVFGRAGTIKPAPPRTETIDRLVEAFNELPDDEQAYLLDWAQHRAELRRKGKGRAGDRKVS